MAEQRRSSAKQPAEEQHVEACRIIMTSLLYAMYQREHSDLVVFDDDPKELPEIRADLLAGRILYPRTTPPVRRLKHVWYVKAHFFGQREQVLELLFSKYSWIDGIYILAQRIGGEWHWVR